MPLLEISYNDFDTVCYSVQHNIEQLIKHAVNIGIQINLNTANLQQIQNRIDNLQQDVDDNKEESDDTAGKLNSLQLDLNDISRQLQVLTQEYNTFSYAVTVDLGVLKNRVDQLEAKVG